MHSQEEVDHDVALLLLLLLIMHELNTTMNGGWWSSQHVEVWAMKLMYLPQKQLELTQHDDFDGITK